jgi:RHS repeat-associated protein
MKLIVEMRASVVMYANVHGCVRASASQTRDTLGSVAPARSRFQVFALLTDVGLKVTGLFNGITASLTRTLRAAGLGLNLTKSLLWSRFVTGKNSAANSVATFDALGNIQTKAGQAGAYTYFTPAVAGAAVANYRLINYAGRDYTYDGDGNVTSDGTGGRTIAYTPWNLPWRAARTTVNGTNALTWDYDDSHARTIEKSTQHGTTFFAGGYELVVPTDSTTLNPKMIERTYIPSPEGVVGTLTRTSIGNTTTAETVTNKTEYWHKDHLGSLVATTDQTGAITQRFRFDPWGARECLNALGSITSCSASATTGGATGNGSEERGFTGHEMLDEIGLIHMNGRLYDAEIGRFLQADPIIQEPLNGQNYNRYGYVQNNPLSYTDPTGFSWWTKWRRPVIGLVAAIAVPWAVGELFMANATVGGAFAEIGSAEIISLTSSGQAIANVAGGLAAGGIQGGNVQSAIVGAFTAGLQFGVGQALGHSTPSLFNGGSLSNLALQKAFAHAAIGCASAAASGGSCKAGAAGAGFSSLAGPSLPGGNVDGFDAGNFLGRMAVGGIASKLAGGSSEQGAVLAAFEYLYNQLSGDARSNMEDMRNRARANLEARFGNNPNYILSYEVEGQFRVEQGEGKARPLVPGRPDAVVIDKAQGTVMLCEFKGGMCSSFTPNQRQYLGKPVAEAWFDGKTEVGRFASGYSTNEMGLRMVAPEVFAEPGSRVDRSGVSRGIRFRGGRAGGWAP